MYIIEKEPNGIGGRSPLHSWNKDVLPKGYAWCPDRFHEIFYSSTPAGFVNIEVKDDVVTAMTINQEALDNYLSSIPEPEEVIHEPTAQDDMDAMLVDHEYRLTLLELEV